MSNGNRVKLLYMRARVSQRWMDSLPYSRWGIAELTEFPASVLELFGFFRADARVGAYVPLVCATDERMVIHGEYADLYDLRRLRRPFRAKLESWAMIDIASTFNDLSNRLAPHLAPVESGKLTVDHFTQLIREGDPVLHPDDYIRLIQMLKAFLAAPENLYSADTSSPQVWCAVDILPYQELSDGTVEALVVWMVHTV